MKKKTCYRCKLTKSTSEFFKHKKSLDGFTYECKQCVRERKQKYSADNRNNLSKPIITSRKCTKCNQIKSIDNFYIISTNKDGYTTQCKTCLNHTRKQRFTTHQWAYNVYSSHIVRNHNIIITVDEIENKLINSTVCPICGVVLNKNYSKRTDNNRPTLDRINNDIVLSVDNTWVICYKCNRAKGEMSLIEFKEYLNSIESRRYLW